MVLRSAVVCFHRIFIFTDLSKIGPGTSKLSIYRISGKPLWAINPCFSFLQQPGWKEMEHDNAWHTSHGGLVANSIVRGSPACPLCWQVSYDPW